MKHQEIIDKYGNLGLQVETGSVEKNFVYPKHHHGTTYLYITAGSLMIQRERDVDMIEYLVGDELVVDDGEYHWGKSGPEGYGYVAGWDEQEYDKYPESQWY